MSIVNKIKATGLVLTFVTSTVIASAATANIATFSGDNTNGTGAVDGFTFNWTANPGLVNQLPPLGSQYMRWGVAGDPTSNSFDFTIVMTFPNLWEFEQIEFSELNIVGNVFSVQMLDSSDNFIDISAAVVDTTSGFGSAPWFFDNSLQRWTYATIAQSTNGHTATLSGPFSSVKKLIIDIDDHFGRDSLQLSMTPVPLPGALLLFGTSMFFGLFALRRRA